VSTLAAFAANSAYDDDNAYDELKTVIEAV
jgi:hypothetical protein